MYIYTNNNKFNHNAYTYIYLYMRPHLVCIYIHIIMIGTDAAIQCEIAMGCIENIMRDVIDYDFNASLPSERRSDILLTMNTECETLLETFVQVCLHIYMHIYICTYIYIHLHY